MTPINARIAVFALASLPGAAHGLAILKTSADLPGDLKNNVVRVHTLVQRLSGDKTDAGSGIVISQKPHGANGIFLCVLTADHVLLAASKVGIGFGNGATATMKAVDNRDVQIVHGPDDGTNRVDLALLGFYVADKTTLPKFDTVTLAAAKKGEDALLAGYGHTATVVRDGQSFAYKDKADSFGFYRSGVDLVDDIGLTHDPIEYSEGLEVVAYKSKVYRGSLSFTGRAPDKGDTYLMHGDSGGPSFQGGKLVGIHSYAKLQTISGVDYARSGFEWNDVQVNDYKDWMETSCQAVPEPGSIAALCLGLTALAKQRSRKPGKPAS